MSNLNREDMVKKLEKGSAVTFSKCHKEDNKSNKCPQPRKKLSDEKNKKKLTIKSSLIYTKPNRKNKINSTTYVIKKKTNGKMVAHKVGKQERSWNRPIWVPKDVIINMKGASNGVGSKGDLKPKNGFGGFGCLAYKLK